MESPSTNTPRQRRQKRRLKYIYFFYVILLSSAIVGVALYKLGFEEDEHSLWIGLITLIIGFWFGKVPLERKWERPQQIINQ